MGLGPRSCHPSRVTSLADSIWTLHILKIGLLFKQKHKIDLS